MITAQQQAFLAGLEKLTRETGIIIGGCGCCGSPWLQEDDRTMTAPPEAGYGFDANQEGNVKWLTPVDDGSPGCNYDWNKGLRPVKP